MRLKTMELLGFKSFPEKTKIVFEPGITVVVGPNGCGKSNLVDAFKWVLGEKQAKNLRGERMEDIIFNGTEFRKPLSLSEVSVTIDNSNRVLHFDSDSVVVSRRIFRDGDSEYSINRSPVRLKDIDRLFLDTGIGKSSYSVMEQGRIDLILSTKAEDRRFIFEEAAGISAFKLQRKESLKKLTETSDNIGRVNDIIKEIEREKNVKAIQAEKTKKYLRLKDELRDYDIKQNILRYQELMTRRDKISLDIERLKEKREGISAKVSKISAENERDEKDKNDIQLQLFELDKELHAYTIRVEDIDSLAEKNRKLIDEQIKAKKTIEKKIAERNSSLNRLIKEREKTDKTGIDISRKIEEDKERLTSFIEARKRKIDSVTNSKKGIEENWKKIESSEENLKTLRDKIEVVIKKLVDAIERRKAELIDSEEQRQDIKKRIDDQLKLFEMHMERSIENIRQGHSERALRYLEKIDTKSLIDNIRLFEGFEDGFRSILFDKTGIHAEKEGLDEKIRNEMALIEKLRAEISMLEENIRREETELNDVNEMIRRLEKDLSRNENERDWIERHIQSLDLQIGDIEKQIDSHHEEIARSDFIRENLQGEIEEWENTLLEFSEKSEYLRKDISALSEKRGNIERRIVNRKSVSKKDTENLNRIVEKIGEEERNLLELDFRIKSIEEHLWNEYEKKIHHLKKIKIDGLNNVSVQKEIQELRRKVQELGPINNLAVEEYRELKERFDYYLRQKMDIEKAREDIYSVIEDINRTSIEMFNKTFRGIQKNFSEIFKQLFEGGSATLRLTDEENVLESGIEIMIRPPGKNLKNISLLSGGERALTAIALLFAIYMEKPSPFCFLDEIDAALDEQNIGRFIKMLREFSIATQFIIVTHNKKTMITGESIYGITMEEPGVSRIVSLRMEKSQKKVV
jgi:chromosome segregation protein